MSDDKMWTPSQTGDNAEDNPRVIVETMRALTREMRDGFEGVNRTLAVFERIEAKLDVVIERQNHEAQRTDALEVAQMKTDARLAAIESLLESRPRSRKKAK